MRMNLIETIQQILNNIIRSVLAALYQSFWAALLLAGVSIFENCDMEESKGSGAFVLTIEFVQVLFHLGTFQLSDLFYNTLGGMCGGMIYYSFYVLKRRLLQM